MCASVGPLLVSLLPTGGFVMAIPTDKNPAIEDLLATMFGASRRDSIENNSCISCKKAANTFRDVLAINEFRISGLCQECQDGVFLDEEAEERMWGGR